MDATVENKILDAAFKVINEHTISGTRMHLIAQESGMAQSNLHYHFKTKRELLLAVAKHMQDYYNETRHAALAQQEDTLEGQLAGFFEQKKFLITKEPEYDRVQMDFWSLGQVEAPINEMLNNNNQIWFEHVLDTLMKYAPQLNSEKAKFVAHIMVSMMWGASIQYLSDQNAFDLDTYFRHCLNMLESYLDV